MRIEEVYDLISEELASVELEFKKNLDSDIYLVKKVGEYILNSGGKRFRPSLLLLSAKLCSYEGKNHIPLAAAIEFIHTATLLHDDVVDNADLRRGSDSANTIWGNAATILVGDYLFSKSFDIMVRYGDINILRILSGATTRMAEGEILQLIKNSDIDATEKDYLQVVRDKTAILMSAACRIGGMLADIDEIQETALADFGMNLGIAFQLMDDCLDYTSSKEDFGKVIGNDLQEGKITMPLIHTLEKSNSAEKDIIRDTVHADKLEESGLHAVVDLINKYNGIEHTMATARSFIDNARHNIDIFKANKGKKALNAAADYVVERSF